MRRILAIGLCVSLIIAAALLWGMRVRQGPDVEDIYAELDRLITDPSQAEANNLPSSFEFTAVVYSPVFTSLVADKTYEFAYIAIARNDSGYAVLNLTNMKMKPVELTRIRVKGKVSGSVAIKAEGSEEAVEYLEIIPASFEEMPMDESLPVATSATVDLSKIGLGGVYEFTSAEYLSDRMQIAVYYSFSNNGETELSPATGRFDFLMNQSYLRAAAVAASPAKGATADNGAAVAAGESVDLYYTLDVPTSVDRPKEILVELRDDDFNLLHSVSLPIPETAQKK